MTPVFLSFGVAYCFFVVSLSFLVVVACLFCLVGRGLHGSKYVVTVVVD
jgi:hypothetical protein